VAIEAKRFSGTIWIERVCYRRWELFAKKTIGSDKLVIHIRAIAV
jgi:hypothetical protein